MTVTPFDYTSIRTTAINLIKQFGRQTPCNLVRPVEGTPADPTKPWRLGTPSSFNRFPFVGVITTLGFPKRADPQTDRDLDILAPGDLTTTLGTDGVTLCGTPNVNEQVEVTYLGKVYTYLILGVKDITPNDQAIIFNLRCKAWPGIVQQPATGF